MHIANYVLPLEFLISAFFEPTDMRIALKPFDLPSDLIQQIKFISPNIHELSAIGAHFGCKSVIKTDEDVENAFKDPLFIQEVKQASAEIAKHIDNILVTMGSNGILMTRKFTPDSFCYFTAQTDYIGLHTIDIKHRHYNVEKIENIVNVSGAGDSFNCGFIAAMISGLREEICISVGMESAKVAIQSIGPVPDSYFNKNHKCWHNSAFYRTI